MYTTPHRIAKTFLHTSLFLMVVFVALSTSLLIWSHKSKANEKLVWGVNFSESQASYLGLDPRATYSNIISDLGAKHIKIHINWNATQPEAGIFNFESLDWMIAEAEKNNVELILVIGMKTGRWPECHTPNWFKQVPETKRPSEIIRYVTTIVGRYADAEAVKYWQIENEPFLEFGTCPDWYYEAGTTLLEAEVAAVRALDTNRPIIVSESGELSSWTTAAEIADIVGVTMYRSSWDASAKTFGLNPYTFLAPQFYSAKAAIIETYYQKPVISIELQAEPWASKGLADASQVEQAKSMNVELFNENIEFAKEANLGAYYFWGAEWWYSQKQNHNKPEIWEEAKKILAE